MEKVEINKQLVNIRLDKMLWRNVKIRAAEKGMTITELVTLTLQKMLSEKE